jgi:DNA-binding response OmpR family regulator
VPDAGRPHFLVAEPDESVAALLCDVLDTAYPGSNVIVTEEGDDAWRVICTNHRDLAILDVALAGRPGEWVLRQIRGTARKLPVIMTAADATEALEAKLLHVGADDFLRKPCSPDVVLGRVRARLRRARAALGLVREVKGQSWIPKIEDVTPFGTRGVDIAGLVGQLPCQGRHLNTHPARVDPRPQGGRRYNATISRMRWAVSLWSSRVPPTSEMTGPS